MNVDPELQPYLIRDALHGLDRLLSAQPSGTEIDSALVSALVRLIVQSAEAGGLPPRPGRGAAETAA